jgi:hypothetical protein
MPRDFTFTISVGDESRAGELVEQVASAVLHQAGCAPPVACDLLGAVHHALAQLPADAACAVEFRLQGGVLEVTVRSAEGLIWRASRPIP